MRVGKVGPEGVIGGGGHGSPHVVGIGDTLIHNFPAGDVSDIRPRPLGGEKGAAGGGGGPLGGRGALAAIGDWHPVLPLGGAEVGTGLGGDGFRKAAVNEQRRQRQCLAHGGAGSVQAEKGDAQFPQTEGGTDALVQQVPRQYIVHIARLQPRLLQRPP